MQLADRRQAVPTREQQNPEKCSTAGLPPADEQPLPAATHGEEHGHEQSSEKESRSHRAEGRSLLDHQPDREVDRSPDQIDQR